jgi:hypothetical protein
MIIRPDGIPLIKRHYSENSPLIDGTLISGFFSALVSFSDALLLNYVSDIGVKYSRLFFKYQSNFVYVVELDESLLMKSNFQQARYQVDVILWHLAEKFPYYYTKKGFKSYEMPVGRRKISPKFIDTLIRKGCRDWLKVIKPNLETSKFDNIPFTSNVNLLDMTRKYGIDAFYVLGDEKILYELKFNKKNTLTNSGELLSSFLSAVKSFGDKTFLTSVSDIGFFNNRLYFKFFDTVSFLTIVDELKYFKYPINGTKLMIQSVVNQLSDMLEGLILNNDQEQITKALSKYFMEMS